MYLVLCVTRMYLVSCCYSTRKIAQVTGLTWVLCHSSIHICVLRACVLVYFVCACEGVCAVCHADLYTDMHAFE